MAQLGFVYSDHNQTSYPRKIMLSRSYKLYNENINIIIYKPKDARRPKNCRKPLPIRSLHYNAESRVVVMQSHASIIQCTN